MFAFYVYGCFVCRVSVQQMHAYDRQGHKRALDHLILELQTLGTAVQFLGIEPWASPRAASSLNSWAIPMAVLFINLNKKIFLGILKGKSFVGVLGFYLFVVKQHSEVLTT